MQIGGIDEPTFLDKFIRGLKPRTRTEVEFHDPQTLAEAVRQADRYYTIVYYRQSQSSKPTFEDTRGEPM